MLQLIPQTEFCLLFDYSRGAVVVRVVPQRNPRDSEGAGHQMVGNFPSDARDLDGPFRFVQAAMSGGRIEHHQVLVTTGEGSQTLSIPMRSSGSAVFDGLRRIAAEIKPVDDRVLDEVQKLGDETAGEIIQIH